MSNAVRWRDTLAGMEWDIKDPVRMRRQLQKINMILQEVVNFRPVYDADGQVLRDSDGNPIKTGVL